jgi:hypothetical protein
VTFQLNTLFQTAIKDEKAVVAEIQKLWALGEAELKAAEAKVKAVFDYIAAHQQQIDATATAILGDVNLLAGLAGHPEVGAVATTIVASAKGIADLAAAIDKGTVTLPQLVGSLHGVKDAQSAVNALVKVATAGPLTAK